MTAPAELEAEIRRLHFAEHWPVGTISKQLSVHADVVRRVVGLHSPNRKPAPLTPKLCGPFANFIDETLAKYPRLRASRLFEMLRGRGYEGSVRTLREHVARVRPLPPREAYLRIESLIGEQAQVDWAHVGKVKVEGGERALWAFVMVLSWSRAMFAELVFDLTAVSLCRSLVRAASALGGCPRQWLFDNPKSVVLQRKGDAVQFHPALLKLSGQLHVQPRVCAPRRPQHKGKVERSIRSLRDGFFEGREIKDIEQGNRELTDFIERVVHRRAHPRMPGRTVGDCFTEERARLLPLPKLLPSTNEVVPVHADKLGFVRFDRNQYSVPWKLSGQALAVVADDLEVRIVHEDEEIASHRRRWGKGALVEEFHHREGLLQQRRAAGEAKGRDLLHTSAPGFAKLCERWVEAGRNVGNLTARTLKLLELYGAESLSAAIDELQSRGTHDIGALAHLCEQRRRARALPVPISYPNHITDREVVPHPLGSYDDDNF